MGKDYYWVFFFNTIICLMFLILTLLDYYSMLGGLGLKALLLTVFEYPNPYIYYNNMCYGHTLVMWPLASDVCQAGYKTDFCKLLVETCYERRCSWMSDKFRQTFVPIQLQEINLRELLLSIFSFPQIIESGRLMVSTKCGHLFCSQCIRDSLARAHNCPTCRKKLTYKQYHPIYIWDRKGHCSFAILRNQTCTFTVHLALPNSILNADMVHHLSFLASYICGLKSAKSNSRTRKQRV